MAIESPQLDASVLLADDPHGIRHRLSEMKALADGWADGMQHASRWGEGSGEAPSADGLDWLADRFVEQYSALLARPRLCPTPEGGVQAEWSLGDVEISLEIELERRCAEWSSVNVRTLAGTDRRLDLDNARDWHWLNSEIERLMLEME